MPDYPIMFTVKDAIAGNSFLAGVTMSGRATIRKEEDDKWWVYGVCPGGIAESGSTPEEAFLRFREAYRSVLFDLAEEAQTYDEFKNEVNSFYSQINEVESETWKLAFQAMRAGKVQTEGFFSTLPKYAPEKKPTGCTVEHLDQRAQHKPTDNFSYLLALPAAA
jgi:predicted RNase H-like HicB family nuclease